MKRFISRFVGYVWGPYPEYIKNQERYGRPLGSHISSDWTTFEHFSHDNYQRGHLPQLCVVASGWKARLLSLFIWPSPPYKPEEFVWNKNGDHPYDDVWRRFEDTGKIPTEPREGIKVRYYRHPCVSGNVVCNKCKNIMNNHGWIDNGGDGEIVCPGTKLRI